MKVLSVVLAIAAIVVGAPESALAQRHPPMPPPVSTPPPISTSPGPASIDVPHPIPPTAATSPTRDLYQQTTPTGPRDLFRQLTPPQQVPGSLFIGPGFSYGWPYYTPGASGTDPVPTRVSVVPRGALRFETIPGSAQVYIDGYYAGLVEDFGVLGRPLELEAGPHRVELRAADYVTLAFNVNIVANQTTRYRGDLERNAATRPVPPVSAAAQTTYVIPNCYAGNRPPVRPLPAGCDIKLLRTR